MRNNFRFLALSAAILSMFTACQREVLEQTQDIEKTTHTVTFVAGAPQTKTTVDISDETTAKFAWTSDDEDRFTVYENGVSATSTVGVLAGGKMTIMAEFEGTAPDSPSYIAIVNKSNDGQIMTSEAYDEDADILVSKEVSSFDGENGEQLQFKREVAIAKMTLKGLDASEVVNQVTVSSTADVAGNYGIEGWTSTKTSLDIYSELAMGEEGGYSIVANESGEAVVWFTCIPQDAATLTVKVEAADGDTYTKEFSKAITLTRGDVKGFGVAMAKDAKSVMDKITSDNLNLVATDTNYKDFSDVSITSMAKYAGCTSSNNGISLRTTNSNSGIVTTASGGFARKIEVDWSSSTTRTLDVYGKNTAYSNAEDLFNKDKQGTKIGSITYTSADSYETELIIEGDYPYIGLRSNNNALVLNSISIVWDNSSVSNLYSLNIIDAQGGSITASTLTADEGEEITLSATSNEGYLFQEWTVTNATTKEIIAVSDGVFTMPAANVNVSATFVSNSPEQSLSVEFQSLGYSSWGESASFSGTDKDEVSQTKSNVTLTYTRNGSSLYANQTAIRFYKSNTLKFDAPDGYQITSITWTGSGYNSDVTTDVVTCTSTTEALSWTGQANSVTFIRPSDASSFITLSAVTVVVAKESTEKTLSSISWTGYTTSYTVGDSFKEDGTVTATYSDGSTSDVTSEASFSTPDMSSEGIKDVTVTYQGLTTTGSITVTAGSGSGEGGTTKYFVKVTSAPTDWSGEYLIVYEDGNIAFNGSLTKLDAASNTVSVTISGSKIEASSELMKSTFIIAASGTSYTIKSKSGYYIGQTKDDNGLVSSTTSSYDNTLSIIDGNFGAVSGGAYLRYNATSGQTRFRYYKSSSYTNQKAIQLYKLAE